MNLNKFLGTRNKAQVSVEYFILFVLVSIFCVYGVARILPQARTSCENFFNEAKSRILQ